MPPPDVTQHFLPFTESQRIFNEEILVSELSHLQGAGHGSDGVQPVAILIAGQTGAGKTRLAPGLWNAMLEAQGHHSDGNGGGMLKAAHLIADVYKSYHPQYTSLVSSPASAHLASPATGTDARKWLEMAARYCIACRVDTLVESACRHPEDFKALATAFKDGGYKVLVVLMGVPECLSLMGCLVRYIKGKTEGVKSDADQANEDVTNRAMGVKKLPNRLTPKKVHDDSYAGLTEVALWIDESSAVNAVAIVRRNNLYVGHASQKVDDRGEHSAKHATEALHIERQRPLTELEATSFEHDLALAEEDNAKAKDARISAAIAEAKTARTDSSEATLTDFPPLQDFDVAQFILQR